MGGFQETLFFVEERRFLDTKRGFLYSKGSLSLNGTGSRFKE
ncbi:hypothetical protein HMPREF0973_02096 [Prevotella veroralis F0319]|uniref:Uncharacterized protein n=1 Tax=Prevotella veroralis F0319 TaxID=649761 RepID=C9MR61_9BACT|nr:hypothetical protein HMPREF0973_02096 [Prevotella veroralis F0319]